MRIILLSILLLIVVLLAGGLLYLGLYPPGPHVHGVDRTIPNDQFQTH